MTFWLAVGAFVIWITTGVSLGIFAALKRGRWQDRLVVSLSLIGYSMPSFFLGLLLYVFVILSLKFCRSRSGSRPSTTRCGSSRR